MKYSGLTLAILLFLCAPYLAGGCEGGQTSCTISLGSIYGPAPIPLLWAKSMGGPFDDDYPYMEAHPDGSIIVSGKIREYMKFEEDGNQDPVLTAFENYDIFIAKYGNDGEIVWYKQIGMTGGCETVSDMAVLPDGTIMIAGEFTDSTIFGLGEPGETKLDCLGWSHSFLAKYDTDGSLIWARKIAEKQDVDDIVTSYATAGNADGTAIVAGNFTGILIFGYGEPTETALDSGVVYRRFFLAKYDDQGSLLWVKSTDGSGDVRIYDIAMLQDSSAIVAGSFHDNTTFGLGEPNETTLFTSSSYECFLAKYGSDGSLVWAINHPCVAIGCIAAFPDDSLVVSGRFGGVQTFGVGEPNETTLTAVQYYHTCNTRYNPDGTLAWAKDLGALASHDFSDMVALPDGSFVGTAYTRDPVTLGLGEPNETVLRYRGCFLAKYNSDGTLDWAGRMFDGFCYNLVLTADGSIAINGTFRENIYIGNDEPNETVLISEGRLDIFVSKHEF